MKELSIEQKAKAYDEAIEVARKYWNSPRTCIDIDVLPELFPEIRELDDEEIRKGIIEYLEQSQFGEEHYQIDDDIVRIYIAWLEKIVEQKSAEWSEEDENLLKLSLENLTELKDRFGEEYGKVGDCIVWQKSIKDRIQHYTSWKPSEEMLEALYRAIPENVMEISEDEMLLDKLYQGLKYGRV